MSENKVGNNIQSWPITKSVGQLHTPAGAASPGGIPVPGPTFLSINGRTVTIDVRSMSQADVLILLNGIPGITATIDSQGRLQITGIQSISGDIALRGLLGI